MTIERPSASTGRLHSLDGLRGVAALIVVVHHSLLTVPALGDVYYGSAPSGATASILVFTPLHILWAGTEAVYVFFVLSGLVLILPMLRRRSSWVSYYPRRALRLYLPAWGAIVFSVLLAAAIPRELDTGMSLWLQRHADPDLWTAFRDLLLVSGTSDLNTPLWSLKWEVLFSLLLPVFLVLAKLKRIWWIVLTAVVIVISFGALRNSDTAFYLSIFAVGAVLAGRWDSISGWISRRESARSGRALILGLATLSIVLMTASWMLRGIGAPPNLIRGSFVLAVVGAALIVSVVGSSRAVGHLFEARPIQFLGAISFSMYLVHEPVVVSLAYLPGLAGSWLVPVVAVPLSIVVGWGFYRVVEVRSHLLAKRVGALISGGPRTRSQER